MATSPFHSDDLRLVVDHVRELVGQAAPLFLVANSLGGNLTVRYLAETKHDSRVRAAASSLLSWLLYLSHWSAISNPKKVMALAGKALNSTGPIPL